MECTSICDKNTSGSGWEINRGREETNRYDNAPDVYRYFSSVYTLQKSRG